MGVHDCVTDGEARMNGSNGRSRKATITLRIDDRIKNAAKYYARQREMPLAEVVRHLLTEYVEACAHENAHASPDLLGARPAQFAGIRFPRNGEPRAIVRTGRVDR